MAEFDYVGPARKGEFESIKADGMRIGLSGSLEFYLSANGATRLIKAVPAERWYLAWEIIK